VLGHVLAYAIWLCCMVMGLGNGVGLCCMVYDVRSCCWFMMLGHAVRS
jgi:hypothetical protein